MKNKFLSIMLIICSGVIALCFGVKFNPKTNASAYTKSSETYTISNNDDTFLITKGTEDSVFKSNIDSLFSAFSEIESDQNLSETATIEILFDNVTLENEEQIILTRNFLFSGTLNTINSSPLFVASHETSSTNEIMFQDFTATNTQELLIDFNFLQVEGSSTNITLFNANFISSTSSTETTKAINFVSTNHTVTLKGIVQHSTTVLYNHINSIKLVVDNDETINDNFFQDSEGNPISSNEKIYISLPYNTYNELVCNSINSTNISYFKFIATNNNYQIETYLMNNKIICNAYLIFNFNYDDATLNSEYVAPSKCYFADSTIHNFPTNENMTKEHYTFDGWFGVIDVDGINYYFDQILLKNFIESNKTIDAVSTTFKTTLDELTITNSFEKYNYLSKDTENAYAEYYAIEFLAKNEKPCSFIAKWNINHHTVTFDSNDGSEINSQSVAYGSKIEQPDNPTKTGYSFAGWFKSLDETTPFDFDTETMPAENITLYAKWTINQYTISFITNNDQTLLSETYDYGAEIQPFETLSKIGFELDGWFEYNTETSEISDVEFELQTMPARNITLYAKWSVQKLTVIFNTNGGNVIDDIIINYGMTINQPNNPTKTGYTFNGWFSDTNCTEENRVDFNNVITITQNTTFYASWLANSYHLNIYRNIDNTFERQTIFFESTITMPENPSKANYAFEGWYADANFTEKFNLTKMPAQDISIYAKWRAKPVPTFDESVQYYNTSDIYPEFIKRSNLEGFLVQYNVDGKWVSSPPTSAGSYDILIIRNEDNTYARYEKILKNALVIERTEKDVTWLIVLLFVFAAFELLVTIVTRVLRKMKQNMAIISLTIPIGASFIPQNQTILLIISGSLVVIGFIMMTYQLVKLHKTIPLELINERDERSETLKHFEYNEKMIDESVQQYSTSDIENLLNNDTIGKTIKEKYNLDEIEKQVEKTKVPIAEIHYDEENEINIAIESANNTVQETVQETDESLPTVEYVDETYVFNKDEQTKIYNSDDPFVRKDPDDYSN